jgi:hypothetical protein
VAAPLKSFLDSDLAPYAAKAGQLRNLEGGKSVDRFSITQAVKQRNRDRLEELATVPI